MRIETYPGIFSGMKTPEIEWNEPIDREHNGEIIKGRPTQGYGDEPFSYAGKTLEPLPWHHNMQIVEIKNQLEKMFGVEFYYVLCGLYEDNRVGIPYHHDEMVGVNDLIVSVSFGASREFCMKNMENDIITVFPLDHGDVLLFDGYANERYQHAVPPSVRRSGERINLTFRTKIEPEDEYEYIPRSA